MYWYIVDVGSQRVSFIERFFYCVLYSVLLEILLYIVVPTAHDAIVLDTCCMYVYTG